MASILPKALDLTSPQSPDITDAPPPTAVDEFCQIDNSDIGVNETDKTHQLEKLLAHRPEKAELLEKNVLKSGNLDPSIQAKQLELAKNQLEDKLNAALSHRPEKAELLEKNVLKSGNLDPSIQAKQLELAKNQLEDKLNAALSHRPDPQKLVEDGIMTEEESAALRAD